MIIRGLTVVLLTSLALSGCGGGGDEAVTSPSAAAPATSAADAPPATEPASEPTEQAVAAGPAKVKGKGMKGGCDAMNKLFLAMDAGDLAQAQAYRKAGAAIFNDVAATAATDVDTALDGAPLAVDLEQTDLRKDYLKQTTATDYAKICVAKYDAPALHLSWL